MTIALITARGGSERVPRKNLRIVAGKPLVAWSIIQAKAAMLIDDVYLTTDDVEIAEVGRHYGVKVIRRPVFSNGTTAGVPFLHAVREIEKTGVKIDTILSMLPTSPLRKPGDLDRMVEAYNDCGSAVCWGCPQKETYIFRNDEPFQNRFRTLNEKVSFSAHQITGDKFWNYSRLAGGDSIDSRDAMVSAWENQPSLDIEIDTKPIDTGKVWHFIPVEEWQTFEVDYPLDLQIVDLFMDFFICNNQGDEVYRVYRKSWEGKNGR